MAVISHYGGDILALAGRHTRPDDDFRRILNYARIQKTYCAWGLVPGSVTDEASPFNECSHAYLAAVSDILRRMMGEPHRAAEIDLLAVRINRSMLINGAALQLCRFSGETFNTASTLKPDWAGVPFHPESLATFGLLGLFVLGGSALAWRSLPGSGRAAGPDQVNPS